MIHAKTGIGVSLTNKVDIDYALKKFKRKLKEDGIMLELMKREYYIKPSDKKRSKKMLNIRRYKLKMESS